MSDVMLFGVLGMPYEMAMGSEMSRRQFYSRVQEAVARLEEAESRAPASEPAVDRDAAWVRVPAKLTEDMIVAFAEAWFMKRRCIDDPEMDDAYEAMLAAAPAVPADPMDWPLPCDVTVGAGTIKAGCKLRTLVARMKMLHSMAVLAVPLLASDKGRVMEALTEARSIAMRNTLAARIPECGDFGAIAQNLGWAITEMESADLAPQGAQASPPASPVVCGKCGADRSKEWCKREHWQSCAMIGTALAGTDTSQGARP